MTTDAEATLLAVVHEYADVTNDRPLDEWDAAREKLLAAINEYKVSSYPNVFEGHELVTKGWYALLRAKAAVCDAYMKSDCGTWPISRDEALLTATHTLLALESKP